MPRAAFAAKTAGSGKLSESEGVSPLSQMPYMDVPMRPTDSQEQRDIESDFVAGGDFVVGVGTPANFPRPGTAAIINHPRQQIGP
jgi:hypothetical protein